MYILNLETATRNCSVSLARNGKLVALSELSTEGFSHAEQLHVFVQEVLNRAKIVPSQLSAVAVSQGPGSYTGLRIGVSAAKGLCFALNIPLIATDTLLSLAKNVQVKDGVIIPMIDARRMEVYSAIFDAQHQKIRDTEAQILDVQSFENIDKTIYIVGDCQEKVQTVCVNKKFVFLKDIQFPSAKTMCELSFEKFQANDFEDLAYFEPLYLKDFLILEKKPKPAK